MTDVHHIEAPRLDPITVYVERYKPGQSRIIVLCYARAWTAYWGAHGNQSSVEDFIVGCSAEYIADSLTWGTNAMYLKAQEKQQMQYVTRIAQALIDHFASLNKNDIKEEGETP